MPALFLYLIKVNVALLIFCAGYYAVLRYLTFYNLNRIYLVTAILFSTLYPLVDLEAFLDKHEDIARPIQVVIINWQRPVKDISATFLGHDVWFWMLATFWAGVLIFLARLGTQLYSLYKLHRRSKSTTINTYSVRYVNSDINPFSFWQNIYINPNNHPESELNAILEHEQIHVKEWHTLDILLGELSSIFYWFNPGVWLMKKAIRENIEFITDQKILMQGVDRKDYQYSLLNVNMGAQNNAIVNNFNMSIIKKRIMMMNAERSSTVNITRYLFLIPVVMTLLLIFSVSKAEVKQVAKKSEKIMQAITIKLKDMVTIDEPAQPEVDPAIKERQTAKTILVKQKETIRLGGMTQSINFVSRPDTDSKATTDITRLFKVALADTGNKVTKIRIDGREIPEVYIDGVKTEAGLSEVSPDNIMSISIAKRDINNGDAIRITTKNPDNTIKGFLGPDSILLKGKVSGVKLAPTTAINTITINSVPAKEQIVIGKRMQKHVTDKSITAGVDTVYTSNVKTQRNKPDSALKGVVVRAYSYSMITGKNSATKNSSQNAFSFRDKLVIINGKESTEKELKKLSIDKIDSVHNWQGTEAIRRYGDKAKNGVVIITTKK